MTKPKLRRHPMSIFKRKRMKKCGRMGKLGKFTRIKPR
jgi:hypothetical protein